MRNRFLAALLIGATALVIAVATIPGAEARSGPRAVVARHAPDQPALDVTRTCFTQRDHDAFGYIISTNFEPALDVYDSQAADDFVLTKPCRRPVIYVDGTYGEGTGSADSFNVTIYRAKHGPGKVERHLEGVAYHDFCGEGWGCAEIALGKRLKAGHWWVSVQANISFSETGSYWGSWTNQTIRKTAAMWQNPPDGFETGCTTYTDMIFCLGADSGLGGDLSFSLSSS